ncbi:MAG: SDR family NAD(P)-dependent oxidoreductase [Mycobacterium sp.]|nr:SDR family NAD(P)-dependent oxidoreductase [Mycobacterium sp.]
MRWALVTGASAGIGAQICRELAGRGFNLVLVARREGRLREVADQLTAAHRIDTRVVAADLAAPRAAQDLHAAVRALGLDIEVLVNNAGLLYNGYFDETALDKQQDLLAVNVVALTALTHLFLADMLDRGRGRILNVASTAAWVGIPQQNVYSASKAYVLSFTLALANELRSKTRAVTATALCPSFTATTMLDNPEQGAKLSVPSALIMDPEVVAREGVAACLRGDPVVTPGLSNRVSMGLVQVAPRRWATAALGWAYRRAQS